MLAKILGAAVTAARRSLRRAMARLHAPRAQPELSIMVCSAEHGRFAHCRAN